MNSAPGCYPVRSIGSSANGASARRGENEGPERRLAQTGLRDFLLAEEAGALRRSGANKFTQFAQTHSFGDFSPGDRTSGCRLQDGLGEGFARGVAAGAKALQPCRGRDLPAQTGTTSSREGSGPLLPADGYLGRPGDKVTSPASERRLRPHASTSADMPLLGEALMNIILKWKMSSGASARHARTRWA